MRLNKNEWCTFCRWEHDRQRNAENGKMCMRKYLCLVLMCCVGLPALAETLYIDDMVRVGIRAAPRSSDKPLKVATTGMKVEVLERDGRYIRVRTDDGVEGWMNSLYASEEPPARLAIASLQQQYDHLKQQHDEMQQQVAGLQEEAHQAQQQIAGLSDDNAKLLSKVKAYQKAENSELKRYAWAITTGAMVGLFLLGIFLGIAWYKQRLARRLGGLEL